MDLEIIINKYLIELQLKINQQFKSAINNLKEIGNIETAIRLNLLKYSVFYSSPYTSLKLGKLYFVGLNPAGNKDFQIQNLSNIPIDYCAITDDVWKNIKHQNNIIEILNIVKSELGLNIELKEIFSTNLYFFRSKDTNELKRYNLNNVDCWEYHKNFIEIVKPQIFICNGNAEKFSVFKVLLKKLNLNFKEVKKVKIYNTFSLKWIKYKENNIDKIVIGLPHLSRFNPTIEFNNQLKKIITALKN